MEHEGCSKLAAAMVNPVRRRIDYQSVARSMFTVINITIPCPVCGKHVEDLIQHCNEIGDVVHAVVLVHET
jgi:hypothetical protein